MCVLYESIFITARKRSLGQGYIFTDVCHSVNRGGLPQCMLGYTPLPRRPPCQGDPPPRRSHIQGEIEGDQVQAHTQGEIEGDQIQAHTQEGNSGGIRSRPTPKGEIDGDQIQAHTQGGNSGGSGPGQHPSGKLRGIRTRPPQ